MITYATVCSGIETFSLGVDARRWKLLWTCEVDPFCSELIAARYQGVTNYGDLTAIANVPTPNVLVAGTPCQSFSIQGSRRGLDDARGQLALCFSALVAQSLPRWLVWENVPNVLACNGGRDFAALLSSLWKCGYGTAYRILDSRYFGSPQRRRRVFVVGHIGDWRRAAAVLFDGTQHQPLAIEAEEVQVRELAFQQTSCIGWTGDETPKHGIESTPTIRANQGGEGCGVVAGECVRRFTTEELEALQGIPRGYTDISGASERQRRKAIGNAFNVNVMRWIAARIQAMEDANNG